MPPASRNHRDPTGWDTPPSRAASSLERRAAIADQNRRLSSRLATGGRPGDRIGALNRRSEPRLRLAIAPSIIVALRRPVETAQYLAIRYTESLAEAGINPSVGSVGDRYDNARAETINGLFEAGVIHRRGPRRNVDAVGYATLDWIDRFNNRRLPEPIGNVQPAEAEAHYCAAMERPDMAA